MSLLKAIEYGKEHRTNGGHTFRHQDGCLWCMHNLLHSMIKESIRTDDEIEQFMEDNDLRFPYRKMKKRIAMR